MFEGKIWWVTGASSGIGAALCEALAQVGAKLIVSGRNAQALRDVAARCATRVLVLPFEATDFAALPHIVEQAWSWAAQEGGAVDGLVNNAGISQRSLAVDTVFEVYQRIIDVDLMAPIALTQQLLPRMVARGSGHIVAISSVAGIVGSPLRSAYSAAKHGLIGYHDSVRAETAHLGLKVLVVAPGSVKTNVSRNALDSNAQARGFSDAAIDGGMEATDAAAAILAALTADQRELILAQGGELMAAQLRRSNPEALFDLTAQLAANDYAAQYGVKPAG
jgi:short-subunit dehydrogenase